jgi:hypothetical protein
MLMHPEVMLLIVLWEAGLSAGAAFPLLGMWSFAP